MEPDDLAYLRTKPTDTLALAACYLNVGEWPASLPKRLEDEYGLSMVREAIVGIVGSQWEVVWREQMFYRGKAGRYAK